MSYVTNLLILLPVGDEAAEATQEAAIAAYFVGIGERPPVSLDSPALPSHWYGGSKYLECTILVGAYNYLDLPALLRHLAALPWEDPAAVQVLVKEQDDDTFRLIGIDCRR